VIVNIREQKVGDQAESGVRSVTVVSSGHQVELHQTPRVHRRLFCDGSFMIESFLFHPTN
jgi:hypothetical protein